LGLVSLILLAVVLFPPWDYTASWPGMTTARTPAGHVWLFNSPPPSHGPRHQGVELAVDRMMIEAGVVLVVGGIAMIVIPWRRQKNQPDKR
jgi:hypothetical protein